MKRKVIILFLFVFSLKISSVWADPPHSSTSRSCSDIVDQLASSLADRHRFYLNNTAIRWELKDIVNGHSKIKVQEDRDKALDLLILSWQWSKNIAEGGIDGFDRTDRHIFDETSSFIPESFDLTSLTFGLQFYATMRKRMNNFLHSQGQRSYANYHDSLWEYISTHPHAPFLKESWGKLKIQAIDQNQDDMVHVIVENPELRFLRIVDEEGYNSNQMTLIEDEANIYEEELKDLAQRTFKGSDIQKRENAHAMTLYVPGYRISPKTEYDIARRLISIYQWRNWDLTKLYGFYLQTVDSALDYYKKMKSIGGELHLDQKSLYRENFGSLLGGFKNFDEIQRLLNKTSRDPTQWQFFSEMVQVLRAYQSSWFGQFYLRPNLYFDPGEMNEKLLREIINEALGVNVDFWMFFLKRNPQKIREELSNLSAPFE